LAGCAAKHLAGCCAAAQYLAGCSAGNMQLTLFIGSYRCAPKQTLKTAVIWCRTTGLPRNQFPRPGTATTTDSESCIRRGERCEYKVQTTRRVAVQGGARKVRRRCEGGAREVRGKCEGGAREVRGKCEGGARGCKGCVCVVRAARCSWCPAAMSGSMAGTTPPPLMVGLQQYLWIAGLSFATSPSPLSAYWHSCCKFLETMQS